MKQSPENYSQIQRIIINEYFYIFTNTTRTKLFRAAIVNSVQRLANHVCLSVNLTRPEILNYIIYFHIFEKKI